jgi:acetylornithine/N-succinyldiaminopimelate aminotransferase
MPELQYAMHKETGAITPAVDEQHVLELDRNNIMQIYSRLPITLVRGQGARVWDAHGKEYLDFLAGIAVNGVGHCHPKVVAAIQEQAATLIHTSGLYYTAQVAELAAKLVQVSDFDKVFFCNSGAEANEAAIKIARKHGKAGGASTKFQIVAAKQSFHGRTMATVTATGQPKYQTPFAPVVEGFTHVPYNDVPALEEAVNDDTCAIILEPIQGESGVFPATPEYLQAARALCDKHGALLIFDEVQTGMGRTGKWWAYQHSGVVPDLMSVAKALGGGVPIGACLGRGVAATTLVPGDHGSTFGGNPLACRAALAVIEAMESEHLVANAHAMGSYFTHRLTEPAFKAHFTDVRGLGLMVGVTLQKPIAKRVQADALAAGLILNAIGDDTLRFLPPLIVTQADIDQAVGILAKVL